MKPRKTRKRGGAGPEVIELLSSDSSDGVEFVASRHPSRMPSPRASARTSRKPSNGSSPRGSRPPSPRGSRPPSPRGSRPPSPPPFRAPSPPPFRAPSPASSSDSFENPAYEASEVAGPNPCAYMKTPSRPEEILARRKRVKDGYGHPADLSGLTPTHLRELFDLYDRIFFNGEFNAYFRSNPVTFEMGFAKNITTTAGWCTRKGCNYSIEITKTIMDDLFKTDAAEQHYHASGGIVCRTKLDCLQLVLEHEMIHLVQYIWRECQNTKQKGHGKEFKTLVKNIFGHTESKHDLFRKLTAEQADGYTFRKETDLKRLNEQLHVGDIIQLDRGPDQYRVAKVPTNKREVNLQLLNLRDSRTFNMHMSMGYRLVTKASEAPAEPSKKDKMREALKKGKVTVRITVNGEAHVGEVVKMNPSKFVLRVAAGQMNIPYDYALYRLE